MTEAVLDASAVLALVNREPGYDVVIEHLAGAVLSAVNLAEVVSVLVGRGMGEAEAAEAATVLGMEVVALDEATAVRAGGLVRETKGLGLSLGDRACLALAQIRKAPVLTADRAWGHLDIGLEIRLIR